MTYAAAAGEQVVISGGAAVGDWEKTSSGLWRAKLPDAADGKSVRQLFVSGRRATRARNPNEAGKPRYARLKGAKFDNDAARFIFDVPADVLAPLSGKQPPRMEIIILKNWSTSRYRVAKIDFDNNRVIAVKNPRVDYKSYNRPRKGSPFFLEHARAFLDSPGEWFCNGQTGEVLYRPLKGQKAAEAGAVVPVLQRLVRIKGGRSQPVRNLHFRGITFHHAALPLPKGGHNGRQACFRYGGDAMDSAIDAVHAVCCSFVGCRIAHVGGGGIDFGRGCHGNTFEGNEVFDAAGNGVNLGGPNDKNLVPKQNRIANNHIHHCGQVYYGACAVWVGFARETTIEHNLIRHHPYTGLSIGWRWDPSPTAASQYVVRHNHIYDINREVCDGGAIYTLGRQDGTVIAHNLLHGVRRSKFTNPGAAPNNGIFFDQGSKNFLVAENVIYDTSGAPVRHNQNSPKWHTWRDNVFLKKGEPTKEQLKRVSAAGLEEKWKKALTE